MLGFWSGKKLCGGSRLGVFLFCSFIVSALFLTPLNPCFFDYIISFYKHTHWIGGLLSIFSSLFLVCLFVLSCWRSGIVL